MLDLESGLFILLPELKKLGIVFVNVTVSVQIPARTAVYGRTHSSLQSIFFCFMLDLQICLLNFLLKFQ